MDRKNLQEDTDSDSDSIPEEGDTAEFKRPEASARNCIGTQKVEKRPNESPSTINQQPANKRLRKSDDLPLTKTDLSLEFENLNLDSRHFKNLKKFYKTLIKRGIESLQLTDCLIEIFDNDEVLPSISSLKSIIFNKCNDNIFKIFKKQESLEKITVINDDRTWTGFPHKIFNEMCKNCPNLNHIVLQGEGTGSFFDNDEFPFKIEKLETTMITFHWYVENGKPRIKFLESQKGSLKKLTIHQLPYDFDGGQVLKYIIEEMNLETFYYGKIPLILNGKKQEVKEFEASELQITSAIEMINTFKSIEKFTLKLNNTAISSDEIEKVINPQTDLLFANIKEFEVIDNSSHRKLFGVFLELYRKLTKVKKLTFRTKDKNVYQFINQLPQMKNLKEIQLTSTIPSSSEIDTSKFSSDFKFTKIMDNDDAEPQGNVGNVDGGAVPDNANAPEGGNAQQANEGVEQQNRDDDDDENSDDEGATDEDYDGFPPETTNLGNIVKRTVLSPVRSSFEDREQIETQFYYFMHPFGYYQNIHCQRNLRQLKRLLGQQFYSLIYPPRTEQGKILVKFRSIDVRNDRNEFREKLKNLAFIQDKRAEQLQLILITTNDLIKVYCCIDTDKEWNYFFSHISHPNELSASHWRHYNREAEIVLINEKQMFKKTFFVDAESYIKIHRKNHRLMFIESHVDISVAEDPYINDIIQLP